MSRFQCFIEKVNKVKLKVVNVNIRNGQISLHCHFNEIIKGNGTSFQTLALNQKHIRDGFDTAQ